MTRRQEPLALYDKWLLFSVVGLLILGLLMVASSSVMISTKYFQQPFHFLIRQAAYLVLGLVVGMMVIRMDTRLWQRMSVPLLLVCLVMLVLVLIPGLGRVVNGSRRWLMLGPLLIQVSELLKFAMILYLAGYLVRQQTRAPHEVFDFIKPLILLVLVAALLLAEPDFGATVVISGTMMVML